MRLFSLDTSIYLKIKHGLINLCVSPLVSCVLARLELERAGFQERGRRSALISQCIQNAHPTQADFQQPQTSLLQLQTWQAIICRGQSDGPLRLPVCMCAALPSIDKPRDVGFCTFCSSRPDMPLRAVPETQSPASPRTEDKWLPLLGKLIYAPR